MKKTYSPREFGKLINRTTQTLQRWDREGILKAFRTPTNRRYYTHEQYLQITGQLTATRKMLVYMRASGPSRQEHIQQQRTALEQFCIASGRAIDDWLEDYGSGLDLQRKSFVQLMEMVEKGEVSEIIIAHQDRLVRFGYEWFEIFCTNHGTTITIMNIESLSPETEIVDDLNNIILTLSSRLKSLKKHKKQLNQLISDLA